VFSGETSRKGHAGAFPFGEDRSCHPGTFGCALLFTPAAYLVDLFDKTLINEIARSLVAVINVRERPAGGPSSLISFFLFSSPSFSDSIKLTRTALESSSRILATRIARSFFRGAQKKLHAESSLADGKQLVTQYVSTASTF
jgi:hypothetical protein